jgi:glycosyltransferase involved in cell wall biosynthesis
VIVIFAFHRSAHNRQVSPFNEIFLKKISQRQRILVISVRHFSPRRKIFYLETFGNYSVVEFSGFFMPQKYQNFILRKLNKYMTAVMHRILCKNKLLDNASLVHQIGFFHPLGLYFSKLCNVPFLMQIIGNDKYLVNNWGIKYPSNALVTANSRSLADAVSSKFPNVQIIYRGVDSQTFKDEIPGAGINYQNIFFGGGFPDYEEKPDGRRYNYKGGLSLLDVISEEFNLTIAGPNCEVGQQYAAKKGLKKVTFLGFLPHEKLLGELRSADIVVIPSFDEGIANIAMESMLAERLVISRAVGGMPELIRHNENGLTFNTDNELNELLNKIATERSKKQMTQYDRLRKEGRRSVLASFNNDRMIEAYSKIYEKAVQ